MQKHFRIFKKNTSVETTNHYWKECMDQGKVHIVITTMRKYARIDYDFYSLAGRYKKITDYSKCQISEKISAYAHMYAKNNQLPSERRPKVISDIAGGFEFYIKDVDKVGKDISMIINDIVKSRCIVFQTMEEFMDELDPEILAALTDLDKKGLLK